MKFWIIYGLIAVLVLVGGVYLIVNDSPDAGDNTNMSNKLEKTDIEVGEGDEAAVGDNVTVHYVGTLEDGTKFDSSIDRGRPFTFTLGQGQVIEGWEKGVVGMKEGGKRKLVIPPDMAYGSRSVGKIPPNSTLIFEVELLEVQ